jgi:dTDP-4-dehydrorhamnose reductase
VVADQVGVPNWCHTLAAATARIVGAGLPALADRSGLYHLSCTGQASWYDFARAIVGDAPTPRLVPITTSEYPTRANRPANSRLACDKLADVFGVRLPPWQDGLARTIASPTEPSR